MATTGRELRIERLLAEVSVTDLAARLHRSRQYLWALERMAVVQPEKAAQYRSALRDATVASEAVA
jgi:transcriptional regulator with XRE-family HTH domain